MLPDFCHHEMKLVGSDQAVLLGCIFSGRHYKRKSVAFQLNEQKRRKGAFKACCLLSLLLKNITGCLLFPLYITSSRHITVDYSTFSTLVLMSLYKVLFKMYSCTRSTCLLLFVVPKVHFSSFHHQKKHFFTCITCSLLTVLLSPPAETAQSVKHSYAIKYSSSSHPPDCKTCPCFFSHSLPSCH